MLVANWRLVINEDAIASERMPAEAHVVFPEERSIWPLHQTMGSRLALIVPASGPNQGRPERFANSGAPCPRSPFADICLDKSGHRLPGRDRQAISSLDRRT